MTGFRSNMREPFRNIEMIQSRNERIIAETKSGTVCFLHLGHGLWEVGGDGSEAPPPAVHNVVVAGAHGGAGSGGQAARLNEGAAAVS